MVNQILILKEFQHQIFQTVFQIFQQPTNKLAKDFYQQPINKLIRDYQLINKLAKYLHLQHNLIPINYFLLKKSFTKHHQSKTVRVKLTHFSMVYNASVELGIKKWMDFVLILHWLEGTTSITLLNLFMILLPITWTDLLYAKATIKFMMDNFVFVDQGSGE